VKSQIEIVPVKWIDKVLEVALERQPTPLPEEEVKAVPVEVKAEGAAATPPGAQTDVMKH
jgi:ATP-dependent Lon protease